MPAAAGGGTDLLARAFAEAAKRRSPQPFVVVNRPGASGAIGMGEVLNARPDGHKICVVIAELAILPALNQIRFSADDFRMVARPLKERGVDLSTGTWRGLAVRRGTPPDVAAALAAIARGAAAEPGFREALARGPLCRRGMPPPRTGGCSRSAAERRPGASHPWPRTGEPRRY